MAYKSFAIIYEEKDELVIEKMWVEMFLEERWELTDLGRQVQRYLRRCAETATTFQSIDVARLRCGAELGANCTCTHETNPNLSLNPNPPKG